ncbi:MAG: hypothetical protein B0A82_08535 [Alkalinema sp. CACIAM 70d]|nr:MAG: hypothetical protein B0A82_08535 [Alkalinema sp. CACIAM 70d]
MKIISVFTVLAFAAGVALASMNDVVTWATATSTHATNGRVIVFRYAKEFRPAFEKSSLPNRVILVWRYQSQSGMPATAEREAMDRLEDLLTPFLEKPGFATLSLVSTGENLREWTYYVKSEAEFLQTLNKALSGQPRFPIEIHAAPDPKWSTYEHFRQGVRE